VVELRGFLTRLRPVEAPGAARAGVPADPGRELEAEVGPVLARLAGVDAECEQILAAARRDAEQLTAGARAEAAAITVAARQRAAAAREDATRQAMAAARAEAERTVQDARRQAAQTRELASQRMPVLVSRAVETIWRLRSEDS
jgi:flagellar biosynthesis/type III secretory pathway protein FliH